MKNHILKHIIWIGALIVAGAPLIATAGTPNFPGADGNNNSNTNDTLPQPKTIYLRPKPIPSRPSAPTKQRIESIYSSGTLSLTFAYPEGMCELKVYNKDTKLHSSYPFDSTEDEIIIPIGYMNEAIFQLLTNEGKIYVGELSL